MEVDTSDLTFEAQVEVKPSYGLSEEEMAEMLYDSMKNAKEDMSLRLLSEARVEAGRNLKALQAALAADGDLLGGDETKAIETVMGKLASLIEGEDRDAINNAVEDMETASRPFAEARMDRGIRSALTGVEVEALDRTPEKAEEGAA